MTSSNDSPIWRWPVERELPPTAPLSSRTRQRLAQLATSYELLRSSVPGLTVTTALNETRFAAAKAMLLELLEEWESRPSNR